MNLKGKNEEQVDRMVGRGWWVVVWTMCAGWTVCVVCGGLTCQPGQEFFSDRQGQCVPCTRCHDPQVVMVPCYVYQDAVCAPAVQFVPNWSQPGQPQPPITLSTSPAPHAKDAHHTHTRHKAATPRQTKTKESQKIDGIQEKSHSSKSTPRKINIRAQDGATFLAENDSEKSNKKHPRHNHRHRHRQDLRPENGSAESPTEESQANSVFVPEKRGANSTQMDQTPIIGNTGVPSRNSGGVESVVRDVSNGANSSDKTQESDLEQSEARKWKDTFFFAIIIVISICLVVLTIVTLSHLRNILTRRKLKRVYDGVPSESTGEARVMQQLLPCTPESRGPAVATRGTVTYIRATTANSSTPSSPTITTTAAMSVDTQRTSGQVYPINPFTMDRLLEQRRVLGPASSVDTNLYIESWQQQDSQPAGHTTFTTPSQCIPLRGSVSACPSPAPVRSYRTGPASASASPTVSVRGLNMTRGHVRGGLAPSVCVELGGGAGGGS